MVDRGRVVTTLAIGEAIQDAKDGFDLWYAFIIGLPALAGVFATLIVTMRGQQKAKARWETQEKKADETLYEVKNEHSENLRDEITRGFREIRADISGLREELRTERIERIEGDRREVA